MGTNNTKQRKNLNQKKKNDDNVEYEPLSEEELVLYAMLKLRYKAMRGTLNKKKCSSNMDIANKHRIYKNRMELLAKLLLGDLLEFDVLFYKKYQTYHCGERDALDDMFRTYLAKSYALGVRVGRENLEPVILSDHRL